MSDRKVKRIPKAEVEKKPCQRRRASLTLLWLLIKENPDDARRFVEKLSKNQTA